MWAVFFAKFLPRDIIRENRLQELQSVLQTGGEHGMRTFAKDVERLVKEGLIAKEACPA